MWILPLCVKSIGLNITWWCIFQIFNGCPLKINCTASWIHPETHDQHILVGAEEGIYTLNLTELHENAMDLLYPRRTVWMFVIKDVLMTLSGKNPSLYRHDLFGLHTKQSDRLTISMNAVHKIPAKLMPKKFAMTSKVCFDSCANRDWNRYTCRTFLESLYWITKTFSPFASFLQCQKRSILSRSAELSKEQFIGRLFCCSKKLE